MLTDEMRYKLMRVLQSNPELSQREIARELKVSLGSVNYCLQALVQRGWVKAKNFSNSKHKAAYMYLLTPRGIEQKAALALRFLGSRIREYEELRREIEKLREEVHSPKHGYRSGDKQTQNDDMISDRSSSTFHGKLG